MGLKLQITAGSRTGERLDFTTSIVLVGRHPHCDLRFDAQRDLDVSTRHADFRWTGSAWMLEDLGSTNGTLVDGVKIRQPIAVRPGHVIVFGADGPRIEILNTDAVADVAPPRAEVRPSTPSNRPHTEERIAIAVAKHTGSLRKIVIGMAVIVVAGVAALVLLSQKQTGEQQRVIDLLLARNDSLANSIAGREAGLDSVARELKRKSEELAQKIRQGVNVDAEANLLAARQRGVMAAAAVDWTRLFRANNAAVGFVAVESQDGTKSSGTGFMISEDGLFITNRHVINEHGAPKLIVVVMSDQSIGVEATVVTLFDDADLAVLRMGKARKYPVVQGVATSSGLTEGTAVAVIGFPHGTGTRQGDGDVRKTTFAAGTLGKVLANELQLDAYAAPGSSGSPVFDARGFVIGVIYSGNAESGGRIVYAVSGQELVKRIPPEAKAIIR
jgi:S1-C subfamily serine protease